MIGFTQRGNWDDTFRWLNKASKLDLSHILKKYAEQGVRALEQYTPVDTGRLRDSWGYTIDIQDGKSVISWTNSDVENGATVALLVYYGHATKNHGYVSGIDYIHPAMEPVFSRMLEELWREVQSL